MLKIHMWQAGICRGMEHYMKLPFTLVGYCMHKSVLNTLECIKRF